jgi:hypothetical protein
MAEIIFFHESTPKYHEAVKKLLITHATPALFNYSAYWKEATSNSNPLVNWFSRREWGLKLLGNGHLHNCSNFLVLGRPYADLRLQSIVKMALEIDINIALDYIENNLGSSLFYGGVVFTNEGAVNTLDVLARCAWYTIKDHKLYNITTQEYTEHNNNVYIIDYLTLSAVGYNGMFAITVNPDLVELDDTLIGTCPNTGHKFFPMMEFVGLHNRSFNDFIFEPDAVRTPVDSISPIVSNNIIVTKNKFTIEVTDTLKEFIGFNSCPSITVHTNFDHSVLNRIHTFDMKDNQQGFIEFRLELGNFKMITLSNPLLLSPTIFNIFKR